MSIIELHHISKQFNNVTAVNNIRLDIAEGEFLTLLGPSGCGKTTLLRMIAGFEHPSDGHIRIAGKDVTDVPPNQRAVNTVFQDYALFPHMSVFKNVAFGLRVTGVSTKEIEARVMESLALVELAHRADAMPHQLSGGQRQRVALARALVKQPKVLLLDEPLSALDANLRQQMQVELKRLQRKLDITFVMVTHDQEEAMAMSDRIAVMNGGNIEQVGTPDMLYDQPASLFVASFFGSSTLLHGVVKNPAANVSAGCDQFVADVDDLQLVCKKQQEMALPAGAEVALLIRPENVSWLAPGDAQPSGSNVFDTQLLGSVFQGNGVRLHLALGKQTLLADVPRQRVAGLSLVAGQAIRVAVAPASIVTLGKNDQAAPDKQQALAFNSLMQASASTAN